MGSLLSDQQKCSHTTAPPQRCCLCIIASHCLQQMGHGSYGGLEQRPPALLPPSLSLTMPTHPCLPPLRAVHGLWDPTPLLGEFWRTQAMPWLCCPHSSSKDSSKVTGCGAPRRVSPGDTPFSSLSSRLLQLVTPLSDLNNPSTRVNHSSKQNLHTPLLWVHWLLHCKGHSRNRIFSALDTWL